MKEVSRVKWVLSLDKKPLWAVIWHKASMLTNSKLLFSPLCLHLRVQPPSWKLKNPRMQRSHLGPDTPGWQRHWPASSQSKDLEPKELQWQGIQTPVVARPWVRGCKRENVKDKRKRDAVVNQVHWRWGRVGSEAQQTQTTFVSEVAEQNEEAKNKTSQHSGLRTISLGMIALQERKSFNFIFLYLCSHEHKKS